MKQRYIYLFSSASVRALRDNSRFISVNKTMEFDSPILFKLLTDWCRLNAQDNGDINYRDFQLPVKTDQSKDRKTSNMEQHS